MEMGRSYRANFLDKTVWALTKLDEISRPAIYVTKLFIACAVGMNLLVLYRFLVIQNFISLIPPNQFLVPWWAVLMLLFGICYIPVHLSTHSAAKIKELQLSGKERWAYTVLGFIIVVSWGATSIILLW